MLAWAQPFSDVLPYPLYPAGWHVVGVGVERGGKIVVKAAAGTGTGLLLCRECWARADIKLAGCSCLLWQQAHYHPLQQVFTTAATTDGPGFLWWWMGLFCFAGACEVQCTPAAATSGVGGWVDVSSGPSC
jgi:hypothetical protein